MSSLILPLAEMDFSPMFGPAFIVLGIIAILTTLFWLWMLIDAITHERTRTDKLIWVVVIVGLHFLGALVYFILRHDGRTTSIT
jgi:hypothetical protein